MELRIEAGHSSALATAPAFGYAYQYQLPTDYIRAIEFNAQAAGTSQALFEIEGDKLLTNDSRSNFVTFTATKMFFLGRWISCSLCLRLSCCCGSVALELANYGSGSGSQSRTGNHQSRRRSQRKISQRQSSPSRIAAISTQRLGARTAMTGCYQLPQWWRGTLSCAVAATLKASVMLRFKWQTSCLASLAELVVGLRFCTLLGQWSDDEHSRLIPFTFSVTTRYFIELGHESMRFWDAGTVALDGDTIAAPWDESDLDEIQYAQINDVMFLTHPDYTPQELLRTSSGWELRPVPWKYPAIERRERQGSKPSEPCLL